MCGKGYMYDAKYGLYEDGSKKTMPWTGRFPSKERSNREILLVKHLKEFLWIFGMVRWKHLTRL